MAIVKASFKTSSGGGSSFSGNTINYITSRENAQGETQERPAFSRGNDDIPASEAIAQVAEMEGKYHYHVILNPGDGDTNVDLKEWTKESMEVLEDRHSLKGDAGGFEWVAVKHSDHSEHDHVHVIIVTDSKLDRDDLNALRGYSSEYFQQQKEANQFAGQGREVYHNVPPMSNELTKGIESIAGGQVVIVGGGEDNTNYQKQESEKQLEKKIKERQKRERGRDEPSR